MLRANRWDLKIKRILQTDLKRFMKNNRRILKKWGWKSKYRRKRKNCKVKRIKLLFNRYKGIKYFKGVLTK